MQLCAAAEQHNWPRKVLQGISATKDGRQASRSASRLIIAFHLTTHCSHHGAQARKVFPLKSPDIGVTVFADPLGTGFLTKTKTSKESKSLEVEGIAAMAASRTYGSAGVEPLGSTPKLGRMG